VGKEMGAAVVNFHPPSWFSLEIQFLRWFRRVRDFQSALSCGDVVLTIENMPRMGRKLMLAPFFLNDIQDLIHFGLARNLHFTFDTTHCASFHGDVTAVFLRYLATGRLMNVHLSDYGDAREHLFLGRGEVPMVKLLNAMRRLNYDGMVTLELAPQEWPKNEEWLGKLMGYSVSFLKMHLGLS
jgi:sugar phosphate isomerase/epimerase